MKTETELKQASRLAIEVLRHCLQYEAPILKRLKDAVDSSERELAAAKEKSDSFDGLYQCCESQKQELIQLRQQLACTTETSRAEMQKEMAVRIQNLEHVARFFKGGDSKAGTLDRCLPDGIY